MPQVMDIPLGWTLPTRKQHLADLVSSGNGKSVYTVKFQGRSQQFKVYTVQIELPKYRLANGRTQAAQEEYLAKNPELGEDFFIRDQELVTVQAVQHRLLLDLVKGTKLFDYFKDHSNSQDEPLILTDEGFVVNGNRRLCAMRELYCKDTGAYERYSHVDIIILPLCDSRDIDELEAHLQLQPDLKAEYSWISKACMLRARQEIHGYTYEQLETIYGISHRDLQAILNELAAVDEYLQSRNKPKQYDLVKGAEYAFKQLIKRRQQIKAPEKQDVFKHVSYALIDNNESAQGRLYERIPEVKLYIDKVIDRLNEEFATEITEPTIIEEEYGLPGLIEQPSPIAPILDLVENPEYSMRVVNAVVDIIDENKELDRHKDRQNAVLKEVAEANSHLLDAITCITDVSNKQGIEEQLRSIEESVNSIREWLIDDA